MSAALRPGPEASAATMPVAAEPRGRVMLAFAAVYIVWGSTYLAIRFAVETIPPFLMAGARFVLAGAMLYAWARMRGSRRPTALEWRTGSIAGVLMLVGGNGAVVWAEQHVASGIVALIVAIVPLWMVLLDWLRPGGERPRVGVFAGLTLGLVGLGLLIGPDALLAQHAASGSALDVGAALVPVAGSFLWALGSIYTRQGAKPQSAQMSTGIQMLAGGLVFFLVSAIAGEPARFHPRAVSAASMAGFLYLLTFGSLVGYTAYVYLLRATTAAKAATYAYVNPVVAVLLGWAVVGESVSARTLLAAAVILAGVAIITIAKSSGGSHAAQRTDDDRASGVAGAVGRNR